jgi:hypothetical protein
MVVEMIALVAFEYFVARRKIQQLSVTTGAFPFDLVKTFHPVMRWLSLITSLGNPNFSRG